MTPEEMAAFMKMDEAGQNAHLEQQFGEGDVQETTLDPNEGLEEGDRTQDAGSEQGESQDTAAQPQAPAANTQGQEQRGERTVPHGAFHAEREKGRGYLRDKEAAEAKAANLEAQLAAAKNPPAATPDLMFENPDTIQAIVQQRLDEALAPVLAKQAKSDAVIDQLTAALQQAQADQEVQGVSQQFQDPEAGNLLAQFDEELPRYKEMGLNAAERYAMAAGVRNNHPEFKAQQQQTAEAKAREAGVAKQEAALGQANNRQTPTPTLQGLPAAVHNGAAMDPSRVGFKQMATMNDAEEDRFMRQSLGG